MVARHGESDASRASWFLFFCDAPSSKVFVTNTCYQALFTSIQTYDKAGLRRLTQCGGSEYIGTNEVGS